MVRLVSLKEKIKKKIRVFIIHSSRERFSIVYYRCRQGFFFFFFPPIVNSFVYLLRPAAACRFTACDGNKKKKNK